jgi:enterochelin esterase-like enzyme
MPSTYGRDRVPSPESPAYAAKRLRRGLAVARADCKASGRGRIPKPDLPSHVLRTLGATIGVLTLASAAVAQPPSFVSPEIGPDRTITLRYFAPSAKQVTVNGELDGKPHPLTRGADGVWSTTVGPLAPDIYTYAFTVDGVTALDPRNANTKLGYGMFGAVSVVEVPGDGPQFYDAKPVPHGEVRIRPYESKSLGLSRTVWVYTPPGYDEGKDYPVLYLLHGAGDVESGWVLIGRANLILDNLIAEKKARPMVVVMPLGHTIQSFWTGPAKSVPDQVSRLMGGGGSLDAVLTAMMSGDEKDGLSPFWRDPTADVMPMIERIYKVSKKADDRAIVGLSMGGGHSINLAFARPELFRYVGLLSPAANGRIDQLYPKTFGNVGALNKQFKLLWLGVGKDDGLTGPGDKALHETLTKHGVTHTFQLSDGRHEWTVWRHHLNELAPLLFR